MQFQDLADVAWQEIILALRLAQAPREPEATYAAWMRENTHSHSFDEVAVGIWGEHLYGTQGQVVEITPGAILYLPRGEEHDSWYGPHQNPSLHFWLHFIVPGTVQMNFSLHDPQGEVELMHINPPDEECREEMAHLARLVAERGAAMPQARFYLLYFLATLFQKLSRAGEPPPVKGAEHAVIQGIKHYVAGNLVEPLTLRDLAKAAGYSPYHFHRMFVKAEGKTPREFIESCRLDHAAGLLRNGHTVTAAAMDAGFSGLSQFARAFRKRYGLAPSQWAVTGAASSQR